MELTREEKGRVFAHIYRVKNTRGQQLSEQPFADQSRCELLIASLPPKITYCLRKIQRKREEWEEISFFSPISHLQPNYIGCSLLSMALGIIRREKRTVSQENMKATITPGAQKTPKHTHSFTEQRALTWLDDNLVWNDPVKFSH